MQQIVGMSRKCMRRALLCIASLTTVAIGCQDVPADLGSEPALAQAEPVTLPAPRTKGPLSLETAIAQRRSERDFVPGALTPQEIAQLTWSAQGITDKERGLRASPSAGGLYPLELYVVDAKGIWHYEPAQNALSLIKTGDHRAELMKIGVGQAPIGAAAVNLVFTGVVERSRPRYGDRAERYVQIEVGHAAQNALLQATAMGLGAVPIAAFDDDAFRKLLRVGEEHTPLYIISVGRMATGA
ncbi:MAG: SagB/ThcOx family dehydrogenase [Polyangiaceae bacterium]|nr:SagB/ThcOx family dehydrogenase [Polyangiaceae bacterium]